MFRFNREIKWVGQEDPQGCGAAALAMILGCTYAESKAIFAGERDFVERGINFQDIDDYLTGIGISTARRWCYRLSGMREEWPPKPFADVHLCVVTVSQASTNNHFVLMLGDGSILDPLTPERKRIGDYYKVSNVAAVVRPHGEIVRLERATTEPE